MSRTALLQSEINNVAAEISETSRKHAEAVSALVKNPANTAARLLLSSLTGTLRQLQGDAEALRSVQGAAAAQDKGDSRAAQVAEAKACASKILDAAQRRESCAAAVDAALDALTTATHAYYAASNACYLAARDLARVASSGNSADWRRDTLERIYIAGRGLTSFPFVLGVRLKAILKDVNPAPAITINTPLYDNKAPASVAEVTRQETETIVSQLAYVAQVFDL